MGCKSRSYLSLQTGRLSGPMARGHFSAGQGWLRVQAVELTNFSMGVTSPIPLTTRHAITGSHETLLFSLSPRGIGTSFSYSLGYCLHCRWSIVGRSVTKCSTSSESGTLHQCCVLHSKQPHGGLRCMLGRSYPDCSGSLSSFRQQCPNSEAL